MTLDLDNLSKKELKKLLKKIKKKSKKGKRIQKKPTKRIKTIRAPEYSYSVGTELVKQKPIISMTNPTYNPFSSLSSIDSRNNTILQSEVNAQKNKLVGVEKEFKKVLSEAQLTGYSNRKAKTIENKNKFKKREKI